MSDVRGQMSAMREIPNSLSPDESGFERKIGMTNRESRPSEVWGEYPFFQYALGIVFSAFPIYRDLFLRRMPYGK